jgi:MFS family permease
LAEGHGELLRGPLRHTTIFIGVAYFCFMFTFCFIQSWAASLVTGRGLADAEGVTTSALMNLGGLAGGLVTGYLGTRMPLPPLLQCLMIAMAVSIIVLGLLPLSVPLIYAASLVLGFVMWGATAVVYSGIALSYPGRIRATGIGLVSTAGRIGSFLGPYVAGVLLTTGMSTATLTLLLGLPAVLAGLMFGRTHPETPRDRNGVEHG